MKRFKIIGIFFMVASLTLIVSISHAEKVSLSTYYPAPFGAYDRIKLVPRDSLALDPHCNDAKDVGTMYYDNGLNTLKAGVYICRMNSKDEFIWISITTPVVTGTGTVTSAKVICVKEDSTFGVCMSNPSHDGTCACQ